MLFLETPKIGHFDPNRVVFGRHESFALRYSWLPKGFQAFKDNPKIFESEDATVTLGVGRNMVYAIRYWLQATRLIERTSTGLQSTEMGNALLGDSGWDPYLEDEATLWLLHWLLATNPELATAWYWFFNHFHKPEFSSQEVTVALLSFVVDNVYKKTAVTTIKGDAALLLRMYVPSRGIGRIPLEEALDSPLSLLHLISRLSDNKTYRSQPELREGLPLGIIGFSVSQLFEIKGGSALTLQELMYGSKGIPALGSVFRLTENGLLTKLEKLLYFIPEIYELRETAGIHQLYKLDDIEPMRYLEKHYSKLHDKVVA